MHVPRYLHPIGRTLAERLPVGGIRGVARARPPPRPAPALARVAPGRDRQGCPLGRADRGRGLLRALAALGTGLVAGARAGAGGRRHRAPGGRGGAGRQRAPPRQHHPGRLARSCRTTRSGRGSGRARACCAWPGAPGWTVLGAGRPRPVEPDACGGASAGSAGYPLLRIQRRTTITPDGRERCPAGALVRPGEASGRPRSARLAEGPAALTVTLVAVWTTAREALGGAVTDLPPRRVGVGWYALRTWVGPAAPEPASRPRAASGNGRAAPTRPRSRATGWR